MAGWFNEKDFVVFECDPDRAGPVETDQRGLPECATVATGIYGAILVLAMLFRPQG